LARDTEQRARRIDLLAEMPYLNGIGRIEHQQLGAALLLAEGDGKNFGSEARSAHAKENKMGEAVLADFRCQGLELGNIGKLLIDNIEPAQPFRFVGIRPKRE